MSGVNNDNYYNLQQLKLTRLQHPNKPEGEDEQPPQPNPQKAPANPKLVKAMNSQTGSNFLAALNKAQLSISAKIGGAMKEVPGFPGRPNRPGFPGTPGPIVFPGAAELHETTFVDKIVSTTKNVTSTYPDGTIKSETITEKYASGKTVVTKKNYRENGEIRQLTEKTTNADGSSVESSTDYYTNRKVESIREYDTNGIQRSYTRNDYNEKGLIGKEYIIEYDASGHKISTTQKDHMYSYNEKGQIVKEAIQESVPAGVVNNQMSYNVTSYTTKEYCYYDNGNIKSETVTEYDKGDIKSKTVTEYYENGKTKSVTKYDEYKYYESEKAQSVTEYYENGQVKYEKVIEVTAGEPGTTETSKEYAENGNKTSETTIKYDANRKIASETKTIYDENEKVQEKYVTEYKYDANGKVTSETKTIYGKNEEVQEKYVFEYEYDTSGDKTSKTEIKYDANGYITSETETKYYSYGQVQEKYVSEYKYDANGQVQEKYVTGYYDNGQIKSKTTTEYDTNENKTSETETTYNTNGTKSSESTTIYANGKKTSVTHIIYANKPAILKNDVKVIIEYDENEEIISRKEYGEEQQFNSDGVLIPNSLEFTTTPSGDKIRFYPCGMYKDGNFCKTHYELSVNGKRVNISSKSTNWMNGVKENNAQKKNTCNDTINSMLDEIVANLKDLGFDKNKIDNAVQKTRAYYQKITNAIIDSGRISRNKDDYKHNDGDKYSEKFGDFDIPVSYHKKKEDCKDLSSDLETCGVSLAHSYGGNDKYQISFDGHAMMDQFLRFLLA